MTAISLQSIITPTKTISVAYPGYEGLLLDLTFLSREEIVKLRKKCISNVFNRKTKQPEETFDAELFVKLYSSATIKGWKGFKYKYLQDFILINTAGLDLEAELEYTEENALVLLKNSSDFDAFVTETTNDLTNFTKISS